MVSVLFLHRLWQNKERYCSRQAANSKSKNRFLMNQLWQLSLENTVRGCDHEMNLQKRKIKRWWGVVFTLVSVFLSGLVTEWNIAAKKSSTETPTETAAAASGTGAVIPGGMPAGIYMETDGILVLNTEAIQGIDGRKYEPAQGIVQAGDYITAINQETVDGKKELLEAVEELQTPWVTLSLRRGEETMEVRMKSVETAPEQFRLGIWVRDNVQGLGTITYLTEENRFGALGHGIHDTDTNTLMNVSGGILYRTRIQDIVKGISGNPGTLEGVIVYNRYNQLGTIEKNTETGIYGTLEKKEALFTDLETVQTAAKEEIEPGAAVIRTCVDDEVKEYGIEVLEVNLHSKEAKKGMVIQITDPELLEKTGGIIQGMSGSPILQNGKLIGAVTHVFVNDPTKGYGIFIENMISN